MEHTKIKSLITNGLAATDGDAKREVLIKISEEISESVDLASIAEEEKQIERQNMHAKIEQALEKYDVDHFDNGVDDDENYLDVDYSSYENCLAHSKEIERIVGDIAGEYGYYVRIHHRFIDGSLLVEEDVVANEGMVDDVKELLKNAFKGKIEYDEAFRNISQKLYNGVEETKNDEKTSMKTPYEVEELLNECVVLNLRDYTEIESDEDGENKENEISFKVYVTSLGLLPIIYEQLVKKSKELTKETNTEITLWFFVTDEC